MIDAKADAKVKTTMDDAEDDRYKKMSAQQYVAENKDLFIAIQSGEKRSGTVVFGRENRPNPVNQLLNGAFNGSGSQTQQVEDVNTLDSSLLSEEKDKSTEMKDGEITDL